MRSITCDLATPPAPNRITLDAMAIQRQQALPEVDSGPRRRVWCRGCRRELSDPESRLRGWGEECDPEPRHGSRARFDIEQDAIPGL
jgi:hypothetical protein